MKNKLFSKNQPINALAVLLLASSPLVFAANYDALNRQQDSFSNLDPLAPDSGTTGQPGSSLESLQRAEQESKKNAYIEVIELLKKNNIEESEKKISALLKQDPNESEFYNLKAMLELLKKNTTASLENYNKALKLDPQNIRSYLGASKVYIDLTEFDKAKDYANKAMAINSKVINPYILLAEIAFKQNDSAEAEKILLSALNIAKDNMTFEIEVIKSLANLYGKSKETAKILPLVEDLNSRYPNNSTALLTLAEAQIISDQKPSAQETLKKLISLDKQDVTNRILLAKLQMEQPGKENETIALLDEAAAIDNKTAEAPAVKTAFLIKLKRFPEATASAQKIDQQFPKLNLGKLLQGDVFIAEKNYDKATEMYQKAYKQDPNTRVLFTLADLLTKQNHQAEAIKLLNDALAKNAKELAIHFKLANIYQQNNDNKNAEAHYQAMLAAQPDNALALNNLAYLYAQQNNPKALELAEKAVKKAPESAAILDTLGAIQVKQGLAKEGLATLEKAAAIAPKANDIQFHLAEAYVANDDKSKAIAILESLGKLEQNFPEKAAAATLLGKLKGQ